MNTASVIAPAFIHSSIKRRKNVWYSVIDGNWSDPTVWISNASKRYSYPGQNITAPIFPQVGDDVYINHIIKYNLSTNSIPIVVNNLYISGTLNTDNGVRYLVILGTLQVSGILDLSANNNYFPLVLNNVANMINSFLASYGVTVEYRSRQDQNIVPITHPNLELSSAGQTNISINTPCFKYLSANLTVNYALSIGGGGGVVMFCGSYNLTVLGTTYISNKLSKTLAGSILFVGNVNISGAGIIDFSGNPALELRGGLVSSSGNMTLGTGIWSFTTNSQTLSFQANGTVQDIAIVGAITLTLPATAGTLQINNSINGTVAGSTLINKAGLYLNTATAPMSTGIFDCTTFVNVVGYVMAGNFTIPLSAFYGLFVSNTGIKSLSANTTINNFTCNSGGTLEISTYNLTITSTCSIALGCKLSKNNTGNVLFTGLLAISGFFDFSGNPAVELRGGIFLNTGTALTGTGVWTFSTNNQSITGSDTIAASFLISGAITLTNLSTGLYLFSVLNGNNAASTLDNRGLIQYQAATAPMATGVLQTNAAANTFKYNLLGAQDVKGGTYRTIEFGGSGVKTLLGNVVVNVTAGGGRSTTGTATINLNGFSITTI